MNNSLPTLWPWLKGHIFTLLTIACGIVTLYAYNLWSIDGPALSLLLGMIIGAAGLVNFGVVAIILERRTLSGKVIGGIGITAGVAMMILIAAIVFAVILFLGLLTYNGTGWH